MGYRRFVAARAAWIAAAILALACGVPAFAQNATPTVDALQAKIAAAVGPTPASEVETWRVTYANETGTLVERRRGRDFVDEEIRGTVHTLEGERAGQHWYQNANGLTVVGRATPSPATLDDRGVVRQTVTRIGKPIDAWELRTERASGNASADDIDPERFAIVRHVDERLGGARTVTTYDDFRTVGAYTRAYHEHEGNGAPQNDRDRVLLTDVTDAPPTDADIAIQPTRRRPFALAPGVLRARLPATFDRGQVYVRMTIAGTGYDFVVDSGASGVFIDGGLAKKLGLAVQYVSSLDVDRRFTSSVVLLPAATIGELAVTNLYMDTIPGMQAREKVAPVGIVGYDFLASIDARIDFEHATVDAIDPAQYALPTGEHTILEASFIGGVPLVSAAVDDDPGTEFILDTGAEGPGLLFQRFVGKHASAFRSLPNSSYQMQGVGGNPFAVDRIVAGHFSFGGVRFGGLEMARTRMRGALNMTGYDGLIGRGILAQFAITTDFERHRIVLEPSDALRATGRVAP